MRNTILTTVIAIIASCSAVFASTDARKPIHIEKTLSDETGKAITLTEVDFGDKQVNLISLRILAPQGAALKVTDLTTKMPTHWGNRPIPKEFLEQMKKSWGVIANIRITPSDSYQLITLPLNNHPDGVVDLRIESTDTTPLTLDWFGFDLQPDVHPALLSDAPLKPWQKGGFETHQYRNLLAELGYTEQQIDAKLNELFDALFTGPDRIYFELPDEMAIISDVKNHDARTEGMSYGMMIAVQLDRKDIFDRLFRWAKKYMQMTDGKQKGYFAWSVKPDGSSPARGAAADGELYFITSLIFASNRWGNDTGIDYMAEAHYILDTILGKEGQPRLIDKKTDLIAFVPGANYTDPSYHLPAFYEVWAKYANDGRSDYWLQCAHASREYLHKSIHPVTGLNPDYNNFDGSLMKTGRTLGDAFRYDSWRVPMNITLDYSWSCADREWQTEYGHRLQNFLYSQGIDAFLDQYNVDGTTVTDTLSAGGFKELRHTPGFIATSAALSMVCEHSKAREFVDRFWNNRHDPTPSGYKDAYYEGILRLFAFMHLSGRYRIIEPKAAE